MSTPDHYAVLGVSPDAEDVVIKAAYRALAQRYHPDKNTEDPAYSRQRMSELNEAYRILGDPKLRAEYDKTRSPQSGHAYQQDESPEQREAFDAALAEMEDRWAIAVSIYPDLKDFRDALARISSSLAFGYVAGMLDSKEFEHRQQIAERAEHNFLERFFGTDPKITTYAKELIMAGEKKAARSLNRLVEVMGSGIDAKLLIKKVEDEFGARRKQEAALRAQQSQFWQTAGPRARLLVDVLKICGAGGGYESAVELAKLRNYGITEGKGGTFSFGGVHVTAALGEKMFFNSKDAFVSWAKQHLCP